MSSMTNPYAPPKAIVRDIADPTATMVPAERATRLGAAILDGIIFAAMVYTPMLFVAVAGASSAAAGADDEVMGPLMLGGIGLMLVGFVAWAWLTIKYVRANGQSIAKKMLNIKVVRADGSPASLSRIFWVRNMLNALISIVPFYSIVDVLFIFGESYQCLHDKLADTIVIKA